MQRCAVGRLESVRSKACEKLYEYDLLTSGERRLACERHVLTPSSDPLRRPGLKGRSATESRTNRLRSSLPDEKCRPDGRHYMKGASQKLLFMPPFPGTPYLKTFRTNEGDTSQNL